MKANTAHNRHSGLKLWLKQFYTNGVKANQNFHEKRSIIFTNQANLVLIICSICIAMANLSFGFYYRLLIPIICMIGLVAVFPLQKRFHYIKAKCVAITFPLLAAITSTLIFGSEAQTQFYLVATFALSLVLFQGVKQHIILFATHLALFLALLYSIEHYPPLISGQDSKYLGYFHFAFIFTSIYIALSQFALHHKRYEAKINQLVESINGHTSILETQKGQIEIQANALQDTIQELQNEIDKKEDAKKQLLDSNQELEQFAYVASHDLKEPLRTVGSFVQLIEKHFRSQKNEKTDEYFHFVIDGVRRMSALLDDLLALSRLNRKIEFMKIDLNHTIELIGHNLKDLIERNEGVITCEELPTIIGNRPQLSQLFQNVVSNALKFRGERAPIIKISHEKQDDGYLFCIKDNGIGISKEYLERVFVIFQRLNHREQYEGTGMGLSICKKIIQNHGGKIWIESTPNEGTAVFFTIPQQQFSIPAPKPEQSAVAV